MPNATLLQFARVNDAARATASKLRKYAILAEYFQSMDDDDLRLAVRYCAGRSFAATDERVLAVGGALVSEAVLPLLDVDANAFYQASISSGEMGEAIGQLWPERNMPPTAIGAAAGDTLPLTLQDLSADFDRLASTGNQDAKRQILRELFRRCIDGREATYLAKIIFGDMRTGVQEGVLHYAIAQAFTRDGKTVQRAQLLVGDLGQVAVLARHDELASARFALFHPMQFMLATPQENATDAAATLDGRIFGAEDKLDGIRAQVHKSGTRVAIYTRTMDRADGSFPEVATALARLPGDFLLDGEIVPYRDGCVLPFAHIQRRLGRKTLSPEVLAENPCIFIAFDILYRDGQLLMDEPLSVRREALKALASPLEVDGGAVVGSGMPDVSVQAAALVTTHITPVATADEIESAFARARACRNEGLVLKDPASPYMPGRRGQAWLKLKTHLPTLDCVVTAAEYGHGKRRQSLSDYTFAVWDRDPSEPDAALVNVGKAYSGVTDEEIRQLTDLFHQLSLRRVGHVHVVRPQVVMEIACDQIQRSTRHASGYALRFPRIKRIRWDKRPEDADRLARVVEIYQSETNFARGDHTPAAGRSTSPARRRRQKRSADASQLSLFE